MLERGQCHFCRSLQNVSEVTDKGAIAAIAEDAQSLADYLEFNK